MSSPKTYAAKCPTCGANLPVPQGLHYVTCRYCQNVITIEHRKAPLEAHSLGPHGAIPSRTLYIDPDALRRANRNVGLVIAFFVLVPMLIPIFIGAGPWAVRSCKSRVKPFPAACASNEELELSGDFESNGPILTAVGVNCKVHIKDSKLRGSTFIKTDSSNLELTLENVTIETTDTTIHAGSNLKARLRGSTLASVNGAVFDSETNMEILELEKSTLESKSGTAIKAKYNFKLRNMDNSIIRAKKTAIDTDANAEVTMKGASEIKSVEGVAIKTTSSFKLEAEGGKIDGPEGAIVSTSGTTVTARSLSISSIKANAIAATSSLKLDYTDGSITSNAEAAIEGDSSMDLLLANVKVQGVDAGIHAKSSSLKVKATKKTRIVATTGDGIATESNADIALNDATIEGGDKGLKTTVNTKVKLQAGARIAGKRGGIEVTSNCEIDGSGAVIDGGSGPGIDGAGSNTRVAFRQGTLRGVPAIRFSRRPNNANAIDLTGTKVDGEQRIPAR